MGFVFQSRGSIVGAMLGALPVQRLRAVTEGLGLPYPRGGSRAALATTLAQSGLASVGAVANLMRIEELRAACRACGLEDKANRTQLLVGRLVAAEVSLGPADSQGSGVEPK